MILQICQHPLVLPGYDQHKCSRKVDEIPLNTKFSSVQLLEKLLLQSKPHALIGYNPQLIHFVKPPDPPEIGERSVSLLWHFTMYGRRNTAWYL